MNADEIKQLFERLRRDYPSIRIEYTRFDSGGAMLDVFIPDDAWALEFYPSVAPGVGVSSMKTSTYGFEGFENYFEVLADAESFLRKRLAEGA